MDEKKFDASSKVTKMQGKDYLEVKWRIAWFRAEHPHGGIVTSVAGDDLMKATITDADGRVLATGHGSSKKQGVAKSRPFEGAETAAIGRALAHAGYGTQFTDEDEGEHLADAPVERKKEMSESEKKALAVEKYSELTKRAKAVKLDIPALDAGKTSEQMKAQYKEQYGFVQHAEDQAKAGK